MGFHSSWFSFCALQVWDFIYSLIVLCHANLYLSASLGSFVLNPIFLWNIMVHIHVHTYTYTSTTYACVHSLTHTKCICQVFFIIIQACHLCGEVFEQFWEEDLEEWHFKDAVRTPDDSLYHTDCQKEAKDSEVVTKFELCLQSTCLIFFRFLPRQSHHLQWI